MKVELTIRKMTQAGRSQKEIARELGWHRNRVYYWQRKLGLAGTRPGVRCPELTPELARQVLALLRSGDSFSQIRATLPTVADSHIRQVAKQHGIKRQKYWESLSAETRESIVREIRDRTNHASTLAHKYDVSYKTILRVAHIELGVPLFRRSRTKQPLDSNFPLRYEHSA